MSVSSVKTYSSCKTPESFRVSVCVEGVLTSLGHRDDHVVILLCDGDCRVGNFREEVH